MWCADANADTHAVSRMRCLCPRRGFYCGFSVGAGVVLRCYISALVGISIERFRDNSILFVFMEGGWVWGVFLSYDTGRAAVSVSEGRGVTRKQQTVVKGMREDGCFRVVFVMRPIKYGLHSDTGM